MNTAIVLVLAVVCFFIGIITAYLVQSMREESKQDQAAPPTDQEGEIGESTFEVPAVLSQVPAPAVEQALVKEDRHAPPPGMIEVARFWQEKTSRKAALEMDGKIFHKVEEMSLAQLDKLETAFKELSSWIKKPVLTEKPSVEPGTFLTGEVSERSSFKPPKMGPIDIIKSTLDADVRSALKSEPKSLAAQVDEILQVKLTGSSLAERGIRIMDTPSADLVVMVGLQKYDGVDAVPDTEIQAVIREAVAEWARRATIEGGSLD